MKKEIINLFPTSIFKVKIDPLSYNKQDIINITEKNFFKNPKRNKWDKYSELYHLYEDFDNPQYENYSFDKLVKIYDKIISKFIDTIDWSKGLDYKWQIVNVTAYGQEGGYMEQHSHAFGNIAFSCIHYVSLPLDENQSETIRFFNPLVFLQYPTLLSILLQDKLVDNHNNSTYFHGKKMNFEEDDMIIFPSYLNHSVKVFPNDSDKLRIAVVMNITIEETS